MMPAIVLQAQGQLGHLKRGSRSPRSEVPQGPRLEQWDGEWGDRCPSFQGLTQGLTLPLLPAQCLSDHSFLCPHNISVQSGSFTQITRDYSVLVFSCF